MHTIAAICTAPGNAAVGMIRISGDKSIKVMQTLFQGTNKHNNFIPRRAYVGKLINKGKFLDQVVILIYETPNSYTGEDIVEIFCHGGRIILENILNALLSYDIHLAEPGEFTKRSFLNGKIDLLQAEAVQDLILAENELALNAAQNLLTGRLSLFVASLKSELINFISEIEAEIEFPDEEDVFLNVNIIKERRKNFIASIIKQIDKVLSTYEQGMLIKQGYIISIFGSPNTGKSTLLNQLAGYERAIVSNIPGTTRDYIKEKIVINGLPITFIDMAGIRGNPDDIEKKGIEHSKELLRTSTISIFLIDGAKSLSEDDILAYQACPSSIPKITVINKSDCELKVNLKNSFFESLKIVQISALTGDGIEILLNEIQNLLNHENLPDETELILTHLRHKNGLEKAKNILISAVKHLNNKNEIDILAYEAENALLELQNLIGEVTKDDILNNIFSNFCIGK